MDFVIACALTAIFIIVTPWILGFYAGLFWYIFKAGFHLSDSDKER